MNVLTFPREHIFLFTTVFIIASSTSLENGAVNKKPPKMWLTLNKPGKIHDLIKVEHETDFVIEGKVNTVEVTCEAEYPITSKFLYLQNAQEISDSTNYRISNWNNPALMPVNTKFKWEIKFNLLFAKFLSLNITCVPVDSSIKVSLTSVHIYLKGKQKIERQGQTINIPAKPNSNQPLVLPCRPAYPNLTVILEKKTANPNLKHQVWNIFNSSANHVTFDPKSGFTFPKDTPDRDIFGLYRCSIEHTNNSKGKHHKPSFIILNVTKSASSSYAEHDCNFVPKSLLVGNASVACIPPDKPKSQRSVKCCSGIRDKPPKMYVGQSNNPVIAQVVRGSFINDIATGKKRPINDNRLRFKDCYKVSVGDNLCSVFVVCRGQNIDFAEEFTNVFHPGVGSDPVQANQLLGSADLQKTPASQKITMTVLRWVEGRKPQPFMHLRYGYNLKCSDMPDKPVYLREYDRDFNYEGEQMLFMCVGGKMFYEKGAYLRLTWKNGTKELLRPTPKDSYFMSCLGSPFGMGSYVRLTGKPHLGYLDSINEVKVGRALANSEIASVECLMPLREGREWDIISKNLTFLPCIAPKFPEMEKEVVIFSIGEKWKTLICTVNYGLQFPNVTFLKDGRPLSMDIANEEKLQGALIPENGIIFTSYRHNDSMIIMVITFPKIKSNHHGIYQCKATNDCKTVTRTMKVSVIGQRNATKKVN